MHDRKREVNKSVETSEQREIKLKKIEKYKQLSQSVLTLVCVIRAPFWIQSCVPQEALTYSIVCCMLQNKNGVFTDESLQMTAKIIELNCDFYTMWNFRRRIILKLLSERYRHPITQIQARRAHSL